VHADGRDTTEPVRALQRRIDGGYLDLLGIPLIAGRGIADTDRAGTERVAVINRTLARRLFGEASALERTIRMAVGREGMLEYRIVGVAEDIHNDGLRAPPSPEILVSFAQHPWVGMTFLVRSRTTDPSMLKQMAEQAWAIDPRQAFTRQFLLGEDLAAQLRPMRFFSVTMGTFAVCSLLLGAFGVYAVATLAQRRRVREFGLRLAVGARPAALGLQVLRDGLRVVLTGAAIGVAGSWFALQLIAGQTFGLERGIASVMIVGAATMAAAALVALMVPAWRAIRTDPMTALRYE
jgi:putative ABC transport system permease protein